MRIAVMGAGGTGGYFGGLLAASGVDVTFIARGGHLAAMRANGLRITGGRGDTLVKPVTATEDPGTVGPVDYVLFCVKLYDTETAGELIRPLVGPHTAVVSLQNGIDGADRLSLIHGGDRVMGGTAYVSALITEPGVVTYTSAMSSVVFGEADGRVSDRAVRLRDACRAAGFAAEVSEDIRKTLWSKFVLLATNAAMTSLTRQPAGYVFQDPEMKKIVREAMEEVAAVGRAAGVALDADIIDKCVTLSESFPATMYASMYHDLARGRRMELDGLSGLVVKLGAEHGVPTPVHRIAYHCLRPYAGGK